MAVKQTEPLFTVMLTKTGRTKPFYSLEEVKEFVAAEREFWGWVEKEGQAGPYHEIWKEIERLFQPISNSERAAFSNKDHDEFDAHVEKLRVAIEKKYVYDVQNVPLLIWSGSRQAKFVEELRPTQQREAAYALQHFMQMGFTPNTKPQRDGVFKAQQFEFGLGPNVKAEEAALEDLQMEWTKELESRQANWKETLASRDEEFGSLHKQLDEFYEGAKVDHQENQEAFNKFIQQATAELEKTQKLYREEIAVHEAVTYLTEQVETRRIVASIWGVVFVIMAAVSGYFFVAKLLPELFPDNDSDFNYGAVVVLITVGTLVIWTLRIIVRLLLSQIHLGTDAKVRSILVQVLLALRNEDGTLSEANQQRIVELLFNPPSTGIVKDDSAPFNLAELISRFGSR